MDAEQSGEVMEGTDSPQQETEILKESKMEIPADTEAPPADANGESEVNGQANGVNGTEDGKCTEEVEANGKDNIEETPSTEEPKEEQRSTQDANVEAEIDQPEQAEKPVEPPVGDTLPEPETIQEPMEEQPPKVEEKVADYLEVQKETGDVEIVADTEPKAEILAAGDKEKNDQEVKEKSEAAEAEVAPTTAATVDQQSEVTEPEDDPTPAAGSLKFPILEHDKTKEAFSSTRTLVVLRGLPGSGKTFLARAIADAYKDQCSILSADEHEVKSDSADGYKAFDEAIVAKCSAATSPALIVVDDSNHTQNRLANLGGIAREHGLLAIFLEPRTEWNRDAAQLSKKTKKGLEQAKLEAMKKCHEEMLIPLYFGWFLFYTVQDKVRETSKNFLKSLEGLESFKKHISDFGGKEEEKVDLDQYFKAKGTLHCTTKFTNYGKVEGAKEYTEKPIVQELYGSASELSLSALFITPRTVGARVALSEEQLQLWPEDTEKEAESVVPGASALPRGSRGHVTLGCAEGVEAVQTGYDLLQILVLQKDGQQGEPEEIDAGTLTYYGEGRWYLSLKEPFSAAASFSSAYKPKAPAPAKKEKKKPKCAIL